MKNLNAYWLLLLSLSGNTLAAESAAPIVNSIELGEWGVHIEFDKPMQTWHSKTRIEHVRITPEVQCDWYWDDDTVLTCRVPRNLGEIKPFSYYRVELLGGLLSQEGVEIKPSAKTVTSSSPEISAHIHSWVDGKPLFRVMAGAGVDATAIQEVVSLTFGEKRIPYRLKSNVHSGEDRLSYDLEYSPSDIGEGLLSLKIVPGLRTALGPVPGEQDKEMLLARIEPFQLREINCSRSNVYIPISEPFDKPGAVLCDPQRAITLDFSESLDTNSLALLEKNLPAGFSLKAEKMSSYGGARWGDAQTAPDAVYTIVADTANAHYDLPLSIRTRSASGRALKDLPALSLHSGDFLPGAMLSPRRKLFLPGERDETVLSTINLEQKRVVFEGRSLGAKLETKRQTVRLKSPLNKTERSPLIGASTAVQENGGLYLVESTTKTLKSLAYQRLFAPFNVLASRKNDQLLVWSTEWQSGASIPDAKVEVLMFDEQKQLHVLATGVSDADGVAMLIVDSKQGLILKSQEFLLRVSKNDRTVVQGLNEAYDSKLNFKLRSWNINDWQPPKEKQRAMFGVTELPLYRPGETVKYRIWLRERDGNRLKLPALDKTLKTELYDSNNEQSLQSWFGSYDANGSHSGEVRLSNLLDDGIYCVRAADVDIEDDNYSREYNGACFEIARFEAQPLWAELKSDKDTLLLGQKMNLTLESGFFSGGPAADVSLVYSGLASSQRFEEAYPTFSGYSFVGSGRDRNRGGDNPFENRKTPVKTDAKGKARFVFSYDSPLEDDGSETDAMAFGNFEMNVEVRIPGKAASSSNTVKTRFSQFERYVGLKTRGWWLSLDEEPGLEAVVVDYRGNAVTDVPVKISVFQVEGKIETAVGECTILSGRKTACEYKPAKTGRYLFKASSQNAASTELSRYAGSRWASDNDDDKPVVELQLIKASNGVLPAEVRLIQPYAFANVLFTMEYDKVVHHWVQRIVGNDTVLSIPVKAAWAPGVTLRAVVRPADLASAKEAGDIDTLDAVLKLDIPRASADDIKFSTDRSLYKPGEVVQLTLRNDSSQTRYATLSVLDDSVYQQAAYLWPFQSPDSDSFLGMLNDWSNPGWYGLDLWPRRSASGVEEIESVNVVGSKIRRIVEEEGAQPVQVITRADIERTGLANVYEILNTITSSDGSGLSTVTTEASKEIDMVQVSGSRITAADVFQRTQAIDRQLKRQESRNGKRLPHVRGLFRDAIYWNPDLVLAPGETKTVTVKLPDNLTRWRVLAWSSDDGDGFAQHQASFETSLPIEVRTGLPGQLFVGDQASAQITARNQQKKQVTMTLTSAMSGAGVELSKASEDKVSPYASLSQSLVFSPRSEGPLDLLSIADTTKNSDGVSASVDVQSRMGSEVLPQSGWLDEAMLRLTIPTLNVSATHPELELTVHHGFHDWTEGWLKDLRDYPHRCWEQTLSRAIGAAYSDRYEPSNAWLDRSAVIADALQAAPSFQDRHGYFRYFRTEQNRSNDKPDYVLSAYTIKGFDYLKSLSVETPDDIRAELEDKLAKVLSTATTLNANGRPEIPYETTATIAGALVNAKSLDENTLNVLWDQWGELSWYSRSELLLAMSRKPEFAPKLQEGIARLQQAGTQHGLRRVLKDDRDFSAYMGSGLRDQCAVTAALWQLDKSETGLPVRKAMLRGVYDLYAGGTTSLDTQASAQCLMGLHTVTAAMPERDGDLVVKAELGKTLHELSLPAKQSQAGFKQAIEPMTKTLNISSSDAKDGSLHYNAVIRYQYDLRNAEAKGTGIALHRNYDVLRNGKWAPIGKSAVSEGDWIRVRLQVTVPKERHFVAVTDIVPGGLVTRDIGLSSVGGAQLHRIGGDGSYYFNSRQTGSSVVRIYAEYLPAGQHEIYYYAQAVHPGDYFAPPAIAELMYGRASRANTTSDRVVVRPGK